MNHHKSKVVVSICAILYFMTGSAQGIDNPQVDAISITLFKEQITLPFQKTDAIQKHWGGTLAYEVSKERQGTYQFTHVFQGGFFNHDAINQVAFIAWKPKFELRFNNTFNLHAILGVGYAHSFLTQPSYEFTEGRYNEKSDWGTPHFMPSIGIGAGVHLDKLLDVPLELFIRYEAFSLAPYKPKGTLPFTANTMLNVGLKYSFNKK